MLLGFNGATTMRASLEQDVQAAGAAGFKALEIWAGKMNHYLQTHSLEDLRALFTSHGIRPVSINSIEHITFQGERYADIREQCRRYSEIAGAIGCDTLVVVPSPTPAGATWADIKRASIRVLSDLAEIAAAHNVKLAYEFLGQPDCSVSTLAQCWEIVREANLPNVGLVLDTFHFHAGGSTLDSILQVAPDKIYIFHINDAEDRPRETLTDAHRLLPGEGVIPLSDILANLQTIGFDGLCSIELFRPAYWKRNAQELATDARAKTTALLVRAGYHVI
mgnify:CR=1 FL=1